MKHWLRWKAVINPRPESCHSFNMLTLSSRQNCGKNEWWTSGSKSRAVCHWLSVKQRWKTAFSIKTSTVAESKYVCSPGWAVETSGKKPRCRSAQFSLNIFTYWHVWASLGTDDTIMMKSWTLNNQWIRANHIWVSIFFFLFWLAELIWEVEGQGSKSLEFKQSCGLIVLLEPFPILLGWQKSHFYKSLWDLLPKERPCLVGHSDCLRNGGSARNNRWLIASCYADGLVSPPPVWKWPPPSSKTEGGGRVTQAELHRHQSPQKGLDKPQLLFINALDEPKFVINLVNKPPRHP